jgi:hypothetical protein
MKRERIARHNTLVSGLRFCQSYWATLDWSRAYVDAGPSPAGNPGPYIKVPWHHPSDPDTWDVETEQRLYPKSLKRGVRRGIVRDSLGVWWWVPIEEHDAAWWVAYKETYPVGTRPWPAWAREGFR